MSSTTLVPINGHEFSKEEIALFEEKYLAICEDLSKAVKQKKQFEKQEKAFKDQLGKVMDEYGIKSMDNAYVKFTRIAAGKDSKTIDIAALQEEEPKLYAELLEDYPKTVKGKSAYVKIEVK